MNINNIHYYIFKLRYYKSPSDLIRHEYNEFLKLQEDLWKGFIEKIKGAKDFPEISETKAFFELSYNDEVILIYDYKENKICQE